MYAMSHARALILAGVLASASAFSVSSVPALGSWRSAANLPSHTRTRPSVTAADTKMDMGVVNTLAGVPLMYALMSANEYVTHRYYQHNEVGKLEVYQTLRKMDKIPKLDGGTIHELQNSYANASGL